VSSALVRPGLARGEYPERSDAEPSSGARALRSLRRALERARRLAGAPCAIAGQVEARASGLDAAPEGELRRRIDEHRGRLLRRGGTDETLPETFALVREVARRVLGTPHYDVQLVAGWAMARGMLAEMETGEGKTLAATLPACAAALAGTPVHVISANDYLVERDAAALGPLYQALGLRVAAVLESDRDPELRRAAYACDVVYATAKTLAFDYLRDGLVRRRGRSGLARRVQRLHGEPPAAGRLLLRGLCCAVVDEADSVLIDEARTPLVLAARARREVDPRTHRCALRLAASLEEGRDFRLDRSASRVELTSPGRARLAGLAEPLPGFWAAPRRREDLVLRALRARHLLLRDRDYLVRDGRVQIIDPPTGRRSPDRSWEMGLHQLLELEEGCPVSAEQETLARISHQQFFRRYLKLAGTTGTAREVASELWSVYGLDTLRIPTRRPLRRRAHGTRLLRTRAAWSDALIAAVRDAHGRGRPVLVGTDSVRASEQVAALLHAAGLANRVLNARQDAEEARLIAEAGSGGRITVSTQMAGRGTDIRLQPGVAARGGLHVVATHLAAARRLDRQLFGRCGRQGDPGSTERILCLEDDLLASRWPRWLLAWLARPPERPIPRMMGKLLTWLPQRAEERRHAELRRALVHLEEYLGDLLAFAGPGE
jgi:preprotein translocase subunit SecA